MTTKAKGKNDTAHRRAASDTEVKSLIKGLIKSWKKWSPDERTEHLEKLTSIPGITLRGLESDTLIPLTTLRQYTKKAQQGKHQSRPQSDTFISAPNTSGAKSLPVSAKSQQEEGAAIASVDLSALVAEFLQAGDGHPQTPTAACDLRLLMEQTRMILGGETRLGVKPVTLSTGIGNADLFRATEPVASPDETDISQKATWLATILVSISSDLRSQENALTQAGQAFSQPGPTKPATNPIPATTLSPSVRDSVLRTDSQELPPHILRLKNWGKNNPGAAAGVNQPVQRGFRRVFALSSKAVSKAR